jgi:hypothetical protein
LVLFGEESHDRRGKLKVQNHSTGDRDWHRQDPAASETNPTLSVAKMSLNWYNIVAVLGSW